jgi:urease accessory protein
MLAGAERTGEAKMLRADRVIAAGAWSGDPADSVVLGYEERYRRRIAMTGVGGLAFQLDLAEAAMLRGGDGLRLEDGRIVEVVAAPEPLAEIRAADALGLMRVAWRLGARHLDVELLPKALRVRRDPGVEEMVKGLGARVVALEAPFNPEGGAYVLAEEAHAHGHDDHADNHDHGHDHHGRHDHGHHNHDHGRHDHGHADHDHGPECDHPDHRHGHGHDHGHAHDHDEKGRG